MTEWFCAFMKDNGGHISDWGRLLPSSVSSSITIMFPEVVSFLGFCGVGGSGDTVLIGGPNKSDKSFLTGDTYG